MNRIMVSYYPFIYEQPIACVDEDGNTLETGMSSVDDMTNTIKQFCDKYNTNNVVLVGNENFLKKFKQELEVSTDFEENNLNVDIFSPIN